MSSTKVTPSKDSKVISSKDLLNTSVASDFEAVIGASLPLEFEAYLKLEALMVSGALSSRGAALSIERAEVSGALPSFCSSWCREIPLVAQLRKKEGNEALTLKELFSLAIAGRKASPTTAEIPFLQVIEGAKNIEAVKAEVKKVEKKKAEAKRGAGELTADEKKAEKIEAQKIEAEKIAKAKAKREAVGVLLPLLGSKLQGGTILKDAKEIADAQALVKVLMVVLDRSLSKIKKVA